MHLWIIMDGNRRWAKLQGKPSFFWHTAGFKNAQNIVELASKKWVQYFTLWALSKENLEKRDIDEISWLIQLIDTFVDFLPKLNKNNIKFATIWDIKKLPEKSQKILQKMKDETSHNTGMVFIVALVYSGQDEIIRAIKKAFHAGVDITTLNEANFRQFLDTKDFPPIDLIIRTGWDMRHSGFTLYDSAYSEYYFSEKFWPEFDENELDTALNFFHTSERRFGK